VKNLTEENRQSVNTLMKKSTTFYERKSNNTAAKTFSSSVMKGVDSNVKPELGLDKIKEEDGFSEDSFKTDSDEGD